MGSDGTQTILKKLVGGHLRRLRREAGMEMAEVADHMGMSRTAAYRQDSGKSSVSVAEMEKYLKLYGATADQKLMDHLLHLARSSGRNSWRRQYAGQVYPVQLEIADLEKASVRVQGFEPNVVPGVLQTESYAKSLVDAILPDIDTDGYNPDRIMDLRAHRREDILNKGARGLEFIIGEAAFHHMVGDPDVMCEQMQYLSSLIRRDLAAIRILPFHAGLPAGSTFPFSLFITCDDPFDAVLFFDIPFVENLIGGEDDHNRVDTAHDWFEALRGSAMSTGDTLVYLEKRFGAAEPQENGDEVPHGHH